MYLYKNIDKWVFYVLGVFGYAYEDLKASDFEHGESAGNGPF